MSYLHARTGLLLKEEPYHWECPFCLKPVGDVGRFFAFVLGGDLHECDQSNIATRAELHPGRWLKHQAETAQNGRTP